MGKKALVVQASQMENFFRLPAHYKAERTVRLRKGDSNINNFYNAHAMIADRAWCETDASVLQFIPYITLYRRTEDGIEFFVYQRGKAGDEKKLHDRFSLGVGGHVEELPDLPNESLRTVLCRAACREIEEELGEQLMTQEVVAAVSDGLDTAVIYLDTRTPTESVHLAIMLSVDVSDMNHSFELEEGVIENTSWKTMQELQDIVSSNTSSLEPWSLVAIKNFRAPTLVTENL